MRAFIAVSRAGTVAAAADVLHVTSSPRSRTIRELERQLGADLFDRRYHQFERTTFGDEMLPKAVEIVAQADEMEDARGTAARPLRIGATPWTSRAITTRLHQEAAATGREVEMLSDLSSVLLERLRHGDLDLALVHLPAMLPGIAERPLARYRYGVWGAGAVDLPRDRPISLSDLSGQRLLTLPLMMQPVPMARMLQTLQNAGIASVDEVDLRDIIGLQSRLARTGELMLVCPSDDLPTTRFFDFAAADVIPIDDDEIDFRVGLAWRERSVVGRRDVDHVIAALTPPTDEIPFIGEARENLRG